VKKMLRRADKDFLAVLGVPSEYHGIFGGIADYIPVLEDTTYHGTYVLEYVPW
jgi:hypothetical protein